MSATWTPDEAGAVEPPIAAAPRRERGAIKSIKESPATVPVPADPVLDAIATIIGAHNDARPLLSRLERDRAPVLGIVLSSASSQRPVRVGADDGQPLTAHQSMAFAPIVDRMMPAATFLTRGAAALLPMIGLDEFVLGVDGPNGGDFCWFRDLDGKREATLPFGRGPSDALRALARIRSLGLPPEDAAFVDRPLGPWVVRWRTPTKGSERSLSMSADGPKAVARHAFRRAAVLSHVLHGAAPEILSVGHAGIAECRAQVHRTLTASPDPLDRTLAGLVRIA